MPRIPERRTTDERGQTRHGDAGIAVLLAYNASRVDVIPIDFQSAGRRDSTRVAYVPTQPGMHESDTTDAGWGTLRGGNDFRGFN